MAHSLRESHRCFIAEGRNYSGIGMPYFPICIQKEHSVGKRKNSRAEWVMLFENVPVEGNIMMSEYIDLMTKSLNVETTIKYTPENIIRLVVLLFYE